MEHSIFVTSLKLSKMKSNVSLQNGDSFTICDYE